MIFLFCLLFFYWEQHNWNIIFQTWAFIRDQLPPQASPQFLSSFSLLQPRCQNKEGEILRVSMKQGCLLTACGHSTKKWVHLKKCLRTPIYKNRECLHIFMQSLYHFPVTINSRLYWYLICLFSLMCCFATISWFYYLQAGSSAVIRRHLSVLNGHCEWQIKWRQ